MIYIDPQRIQDLFVGAFEGGSNYWLGRGRVKLISPKREDLPDDGVVWYGNRKRNVFAEDFKITIELLDEDETVEINPAKVQKGLKIMAREYPVHFTDFIREEDDADTSDVFLQLCLFEEIVYG